MSELTLAPVEGSPYEKIVKQTMWEDRFNTDSLRVAEELNWLVTVDESEAAVKALVGYSTDTTKAWNICPPESLHAAEARMTGLFGSKFLPFDDDRTAKGLGSKITNSPEALRHSATKEGIVVRTVGFTAMSEIYRRDLDDAVHGRLYLLARHGLLLAGSLVGDTLTGSRAATLRAIQYMEKQYDDKPLVLMDTPPSWQMANEQHHIAQTVPPQTMLVRGGRFSDRNVMHRVGSYERPAKH